MGLFDIFKGNQYKQDLLKLQKLVLVNSPNRLILSKQQLLHDAYRSVNNDLRIIKDCIELVNTSSNPEVFFSRWETLLDKVKHLILFEPYVNFSGESPSESYNKLISQYEQSVNDFLHRYYLTIEKKITNLKTEKAKENNLQKAYDKLQPFYPKLNETHKKYIENQRTICTFSI